MFNSFSFHIPYFIHNLSSYVTLPIHIQGSGNSCIISVSLSEGQEFKSLIISVVYIVFICFHISWWNMALPTLPANVILYSICNESILAF